MFAKHGGFPQSFLDSRSKQEFTVYRDSVKLTDNLYVAVWTPAFILGKNVLIFVNKLLSQPLGDIS